jgi:cytochrome c oxidase assembly protein subunit 15
MQSDNSIQPAERPSGRSSVWLPRLAVLTAGSTLLLLLAGALVVSTRSSLSVPDWPLSFGQVMPPMVGGVFYEHGHRMMATAVGFLMTVLAIWLWRVEPRAWVRRLGMVGLIAVILQGILGGITVLYLLPAPVSITHACLAQIFFCISLTLALATSDYWRRPLPRVRDDGSPAFHLLCAAATTAIFLQLITGAGLRHRVFSIWPHLTTLLPVCLCVGWVVYRAMRQPEQRPFQQMGIALGVLLILQVLLGMSAYFARESQVGHPGPATSVIWLTSIHLITGATLLGLTWLLTVLAFRRSAATIVG